MRLLLSLALAAACASAAHASTLRDDFTYTYTLDGTQHVTTFSLLDGQAATRVTSDGLFYDGVVLNNDPASTATISFGTPVLYERPDSPILYDDFKLFIMPTSNSSLYDFGSLDLTTIESSFNGTALTFTPYSDYLYGGVSVGGQRVFFQKTKLTIAQTALPDPPAVYNPRPINLPSTTAVTPEPDTLTLLGTGLLGIAEAARRRLLRTA